MKYLFWISPLFIFVAGAFLGICGVFSLRYLFLGTVDLKEEEKVVCKPWFDIPKETQKRLVDRHVTVRAGGSQGSGCLIKPGYYLTALHVLGENPGSTVIAVNNYRAKVVSDTVANKKYDLAVLSTFAEIDKKETQLESYNEFLDNQDIIIVGSPGEMEPFAQPAKIISDVMEGYRQIVKADSKIISSQYIESGISGGCVYSADGLKLLGVVTKKYGTTSSIGEATFVSKPIQ